MHTCNSVCESLRNLNLFSSQYIVCARFGQFLSRCVDFVPSSKVVPIPDSFYIPSTNPKNSRQDFEARSKIKNTSIGPLSLMPVYNCCPFCLVSFGNAKNFRFSGLHHHSQFTQFIDFVGCVSLIYNIR